MNFQKKLLIAVMGLSGIGIMGCATRTFTITSDPTGAKVFYVNQVEKDFRGYSPINVSDRLSNIGPTTKILLEKEGYRPKSVNVSGFPGNEISLFVELEKEDDPQAATSDFTVDEYATDRTYPKEPEAKQVEIPQKIEAATSPVAPIPEPEASVAPPPVVEQAPAPQPVPAPVEAMPEPPMMVDNEKALSEIAMLEDRIHGLEQKLLDMYAQQAQFWEAEQEKNRKAAEKPVEAMPEPGEDLRKLESALASKSKDQVNQAVAYMISAQRHVQARRYNEALLDLFKAVAVDPEFAHAYALMGSTYYLLGDYKSAVDAWDKSLKLDPSNREVQSVAHQIRLQYLGGSY